MPSALTRNPQNTSFVWRKALSCSTLRRWSACSSKGDGVDYDVINVYLRKRSTWSKKVVHGTLKSTGGVAQPKRHDFELVRSEFGPKSSTGNIFRKDSNLVITLRQVYFAEKLRSFHAIKYFINQDVAFHLSFLQSGHNPQKGFGQAQFDLR